MKVNRPAIEANYAGYQLTAADKAFLVDIGRLYPHADGDVHIIERTPVLTQKVVGWITAFWLEELGRILAEGMAPCRKSDFWHLPPSGQGQYVGAMETFTAILSGVPLWVYPLFVYGVYSGVRGCFPRTIRQATLLILPLLFLGLSVSALVTVVPKAPLVLALYLLFLVLGVTLGWFFLTKEPLSTDKQKGELRLPGSALGLVLFVVIFTVKFAFGYESAVAPEAAFGPVFLAVVFGTSGVISGVAAGRSSRLYAWSRG